MGRRGGIDQGFRVGTSKREITPDDLTNLNPMGGAFARVHDPLHVRVVVFDDGSRVVAIIALDVIEVGSMDATLARIEREIGIPASSVLLVGSHSHNAPRIGQVSPGALALASRPEFEAFGAMVVEEIIDALHEAMSGRRAARVGSGSGHVDVNVNRDRYVSGSWVEGRNEDGPSDKTLRVMRLEDEQGVCIALLINYAVHCTVAVGTSELSADLAGFTCAWVEAQIGNEALALWVTGALGDQNPRIRLVDQQERAGIDCSFAWDAIAAQGIMIGAEVLAVDHGITCASDARVLGLRHAVELRTQQGNDDRDDRSHPPASTVELPLSVLRIGDTAICGAGGEVLEGVAARVREASPLRDVWLASLVNDRVGYLTTDDAYSKRTFEAERSPAAEGTAESAIVDTFSDLLRQAMQAVRRTPS